MIYLDSAATSLLKPPSVVRATAMAMRTMASPGRGGHSAAMRAADTVFTCREAAAELFHVPEPERVVFTMNATHALNIAIHSLVSPGDPVVISGYEHNSVTRPLHALGAQVRVAESSLFEPEAAVSAFRRALPGAKAVVCTMVSNVFGYLLPVREIAELCAAAGVPLIVDASQAAGCVAFDAAALGAAFVAMPGHKGLLGPAGLGLLLLSGKMAHALDPLIAGGTGSASDKETLPDYLPDRFESGTPNMAGIYGLEYSLGFVEGRGIEALRAHELALTKRFIDGLDGIANVRLCGTRQLDRRVGVISLDFIGQDNAEVAFRLETEFGILTRCGLHCAPNAHKTLSTFPQGTVRFSLGFANTENDVDRALEAVKRLAKQKTEGVSLP